MIAGAMVTTARGALLTRYRPLLLGHPLVLAFATVAELRYGAYRNGVIPGWPSWSSSSSLSRL